MAKQALRVWNFTEVIPILSDAKIENVNPIAITQTEVILSYNEPCWADSAFSETIKRYIELTPFSPSSDTEIVLGVLLRGNKLNLCVGDERKQLSLILNTFNVEGQFRGFKLFETFD